MNNALKEEMDNSTVANFATVQNEGGSVGNEFLDALMRHII